jgi:hypothetical protein
MTLVRFPEQTYFDFVDWRAHNPGQPLKSWRHGQHDSATSTNERGKLRIFIPGSIVALSSTESAQRTGNE